MDKTVPFVHWRTIKFGETDAAAIVYTPRFSDFCMEAAEVWFREYLGYDWYRVNTCLGMGTPVVHMAMDFKGPLRGGDLLTIEVQVESSGNSSLTLTFEGMKETPEFSSNKPSFFARFVYCFTGEGKTMPIPKEQLDAIQDYIAKSKETD